MTERKGCWGQPTCKAPLRGHSGVVQLSRDAAKGGPASHPYQFPPHPQPWSWTLRQDADRSVRWTSAQTPPLEKALCGMNSGMAVGLPFFGGAGVAVPLLQHRNPLQLYNGETEAHCAYSLSSVASKAAREGSFACDLIHVTALNSSNNPRANATYCCCFF